MAKRPDSLNFDLLAPVYDLGIWFLTLFTGGEKRFREEPLIETMPLEGTRLLELFSGTASLALMAAERGARAVALDRSAAMLRVAGEKAARAGFQLSRVRGDSALLPFREGSFDRVIACLGMHEVPVAAMELALEESFRVLAPGGRLVIMDFHRAEGLAGFIQKLLFLFVEGEDARRWVAVDIQTLLREKGFKGFRRRFLYRGTMQIITVQRP